MQAAWERNHHCQQPRGVWHTSTSAPSNSSLTAAHLEVQCMACPGPLQFPGGAFVTCINDPGVCGRHRSTWQHMEQHQRESHGLSPLTPQRCLPTAASCPQHSRTGQQHDECQQRESQPQPTVSRPVQSGCGMGLAPWEAAYTSLDHSSCASRMLLSSFPAGMQRELNFISFACALCIGSLELCPHCSLGALRVK